MHTALYVLRIVLLVLAVWSLVSLLVAVPLAALFRLQARGKRARARGEERRSWAERRRRWLSTAK
ncbi:MAG TPA: hypothetical protein VFG59_12880 [Anaeromyxobacter sp.]|nr:hypothetical protein [Anaeromyxobacter sp.]